MNGPTLSMSFSLSVACATSDWSVEAIASDISVTHFDRHVLPRCAQEISPELLLKCWKHVLGDGTLQDFAAHLIPLAPIC